ncbi:hypothetical protein NPIL_661251 [Nephila pilipes]|uniref:F-box domain-containing protein n=1 Tax=Nephila pilipes TaxID=299642 RepID=A0A8X6UEZ6_NEPPI|nr:hypothetical protein NPIL_661251 [Nephila pilipes]
MAPYPEEIDVFSAPHSRMKALVDVYLEKLTCTDFTDYAALESLLHDLHHTFCEFKSHEQIENKYIMRKLKKRLKLLSIHDAAVCNCHSDNKLSDMLALVEDGYSCTSKTETERINFGLKLRHALQEFTGSFLPHMKEEEEVFQPMLMKYFEYEELKCLKDRVIEEHNKWHVSEKHSLEEALFCDKKLDGIESHAKNYISLLPPEVLSQILSYMSPKDLLHCSEVCHQWYNVAKSPSLWKEIYPCFWAHDIWEDYDENHEDRVKNFYPDAKIVFKVHHDEDADVDEYEDEDSSLYEETFDDGPSKNQQKEMKALQSMVKYLLPLVGSGVQKIVVSSSKSLTSSLVNIWEDYDENHEDRVKNFYPDAKIVFKVHHDEDADVDEYEDEDSSLYEETFDDGPSKNQQKEMKALQSMVKYLLPLVGSGVQKIVVSSSKSLTSSLLRSMLVLCPNVSYLDVSYTAIVDSAFKGLKEHSSCINLQYLNLSGCQNITDLGLYRLADCMAMLPPHVPEGTDHLRNVYLEDCRRFQSNIGDQPCDCICEIEDSGLWFQKVKPCCQCRVNEFCNSVCFWQKDGIMCHLAKLSLQCPFANSQEPLDQQSRCFMSPGASSILKTTATLLDNSMNEGRPENKSLLYLNLSGCKKITDEGLRCLFDAGVLEKLEFLDVSGCWLLSGPELCSVTDSLAYLMPENIFYCDQIFDGPYPETANGCQNLENGTRACCRQILL